MSAEGKRLSTRAFTLGALLVALAIACVVSLWASGHPDGLEYVALSTGFLAAAEDSATAASPLADYGAAFVENPWLSVALAGAIGCALTFALAWLLAVGTRRRHTDEGR